MIAVRRISDGDHRINLMTEVALINSIAYATKAGNND
jgi:hypothetical protein